MREGYLFPPHAEEGRKLFEDSKTGFRVATHADWAVSPREEQEEEEE